VFNLHEFRLANHGPTARIEHLSSGSRFIIHRDQTWWFVGYYSVGDGLEWAFDQSWMTLVPLIGVWLTELKRHVAPVHVVFPSRFASSRSECRRSDKT
jgi:hypothetical protein